ncbi:MAG: hypothetical protein KBT34_10300 [Prevotella sp.]|nr:hypothetical protein [Candidatus Prevotella equi]
MEKVIQEALEYQYKDYFFLGRERNDNENFIGLETSAVEDNVRSLFKDVMIADANSKWWLLDAVLKAFEFCNDKEYEEFRKRIKLCKRGRYMNGKMGKIPQVNTVKEIL